MLFDFLGRLKMTEVIYKIRYFNPIRESREQIENEIKEKIVDILKTNSDVIGYDITRFVTDNNSNGDLR